MADLKHLTHNELRAMLGCRAISSAAYTEEMERRRVSRLPSRRIGRELSRDDPDGGVPVDIHVNVSGADGDERIRVLAREGAEQAIGEYAISVRRRAMAATPPLDYALYDELEIPYPHHDNVVDRDVDPIGPMPPPPRVVWLLAIAAISVIVIGIWLVWP